MTRDPDRLYKLLPVVYRERDEERGFPLRAVLRVMSQQVDVVEADIEQLYENWFIETSEDWVVPYIGDLIGYQSIHDAGEPVGSATEEDARNRVLVPRRDVANTIRYRRRKGARALLELLANDVAGWPARVVEFGRLVGVTQALNNARPDAGVCADLGIGDILDLVDGPFDRLTHTVDVRRISSGREDGRYGLGNVGVFVWRLRPCSMTKSPAYLVEERSGDHSFTFSILGIDTRLYGHPIPEASPTDIAQEPNLPVPIRRRAFEQRTRRRREVERRASEAYYGEGKSVALWIVRDAATHELELIPRDRVVPANLTDWTYEPPPGLVALDPILGRIVFAAGHAPADGVWVSYYYGFPAEIGGGEYERTLRAGFRPPRELPAESGGTTGRTPMIPLAGDVAVRVPQRFTVGKSGTVDFVTITDALNAVAAESDATANAAPARGRRTRRAQPAATPTAPPAPIDAIIEIVDSEVYEEEQLQIDVKADQWLEIRAASGARPVIRRVDFRAGRQDDLIVTVDRGSRFFLDGVLVGGRGLEVRSAGPDPNSENQQNNYAAPAPAQPEAPPDRCATRRVTIRHCTLVPGWALHSDCSPMRPAEPSITLRNAHADLIIDSSIVGSIQVNEDARDAEPVRITVTDSIIDATAPDREAIGASGERRANAVLHLERTTVIGSIDTHAIELAENCILDGIVSVARRQIGCVRFCYVPPSCRTPRRYRCQPETAVGDATGEARERIEQRVQPRFNSRRYGSDTYCQLADACPAEIACGADDGSEMGVYHRLYQPQRTTNLRTRLTEYVPAGVDVDLIFAS